MYSIQIINSTPANGKVPHLIMHDDSHPFAVVEMGPNRVKRVFSRHATATLARRAIIRRTKKL